MPGLIVFKRRWSLGSDDLIMPSFCFLLIHSSWLVILTYLFVSVNERDWRYPCMTELYEHVLGYLIILSGCIITELCICFISTRGTIMDNEPRASMQYLLYVRLGILMVEIVWLGIGLIWLYHNYEVCDHGRAKDVIFTFTLCNSVLIFMVFVIGWCAFDRAGRSFVKMKRYQNSLKESQCKYKYKRSGSTHRNWRHRKAVLGYQDSWNRRCQMLFCCLGNSDRNQSSFTEVAKILSEFFRDLDVVPTDIIAGLIIVRKQQKMQRELMVNSFNNDINQFLSGVPITYKTKFLDVSQPEVADEINTLIYYLDYAIAPYGYLMYFMMSNKATACCKLCPYLKCKSACCFNVDMFNCFCRDDETGRTRKKSSITSDISKKMFLNQVSGDNCCACNYAALNRLLKNKNYDLVYSSYHVEIGEPPFIVVLDHDRKNLVISVRGTLSLQDIITDLNAEGDLLPVNPPKEDWTAHKGMIEAAVFVQTELEKNKIIERALNFDLEKNTQSYTITLVGHSLGAGVCSILSILLKQSKFPDLVCYAYAPPGGLLSHELVEYSKSFITSVVLGKDIVPRLGLRQMESLRYDLIHAIKESDDPKYKIIGSVLCCCPGKSSSGSEIAVDMDSTSIGEISNGFNGSTSNGGLLEDTLPISTCSTSYTRSEKELSAHPHDSSIALSVHKPLYPGGKMIHIVRTHSDDKGTKNTSSHQSKWRKIVKKRDVVYKAIYVDNTDFNEILITPVMIQDHMPNRIMGALQKLFANPAAQKVQRCKTISNGSYPNIGRFRDHHYNNDLARPLLSCSNWSTDTLDRTSTIQIQPSRQNQYEYPEMDLRPSSKNEDLQRTHPINSFRSKKKQNAGSINDIIRKMKKIDLSTDDWISAIGKAPLATPETTSLSETSSICSRTTANDLIINRNSNLKTVTEGILKEASDSVAIQIESEPPPAEDLSKVDVSLNIDVNALFDRLEKTNASSLDKLDARRALEEQLNAQSNRNKFVKRTSSLKRTDSTSSTSKRVTFDSTTVINTGETVLIKNPQCRRSNSERIRRKVFSPIAGSSKNQKLKQIRQEAESQQKQMPVKDRDQVDNELNEKLEELLGHSFSYSDTDLNKIDDENVKLAKSKLDEEERNVHGEPLTTSENTARLEYSPVKQVYSPTSEYASDDYQSIKIATNMGNQIVVANVSNEPSPKKSPAAATFKPMEEFSNDLYDKEQYEKLFLKLSTIESPIEEELTTVCDTNKKFKSDLNQINE